MGVPSKDEMAKALLGPPLAHSRPLVLLLREPWLIPILILAVGARLYQLTAASIWGDEGSSLLLAQYAPSGIWFHAARDVHPPLYFVLLHYWTALFGDSILSIRLMSAVPGVLTVFLGTWLVYLTSTRRAALLACLLLALLPTAVRYSQEIRMYSLMCVWLMGATLALVHWVRAPRRARYLAIYVVLMAAGFYTHYFTALCVLAHWLYLLVLRLQAEHPCHCITRPGWWLANVAIVVLYLPWLPGLLDLVRHWEALKVGGDVDWEPAITAGSLPSMLWQLLAQDDGENMPWWLFVSVPLLVLAVCLSTALSDRSRYRFDLMMVIYSVLPLSVVFAISLVSPIFIERYLTAYALGLAILFALTIDRLARRSRVLAAGLLGVVLVVFGLGLKNNYTVDPNDQFSAMVDYVNQHAVAGDRVVLGDMFWYLTYGYYDRAGVQMLLFTPPSADGTSTRPNEYGFGTLIDQQAGVYLDSLELLPEGNGRAWLVMSREAPDEFPSIPGAWREVARHAGGDTQAVLYDTCHPVCRSR